MSTQSNVDAIQRHPQRHMQNNVWPDSWALCGPVTLTHKINHHTVPSFPLTDPHEVYPLILLCDAAESILTPGS